MIMRGGKSITKITTPPNHFRLYVPSPQAGKSDMESPKPSSIGCRESDGSFTDVRFHDEIMSGVDDAPLQVASALREV